MATREIAAVLVAVTVWGGMQPALCQNAADSDSLDGISGLLLAKEIELMQMNTRFRLNTKREIGAHKLAVALLSTAAYSVADAGNIVTFRNGFRFHTHPQTFSRGCAQSGPFLIFLGELFFLSRTATAATIDWVHAKRSRDRQFDKQTFERHALRLNTEIADLLRKREALSAGAQDGGIAVSEQTVLVALAREAGQEFVRDYARATQIQNYRIWDNVMANATSASGAFAGALPTYLAAVNKRPRLTGPGGIGFMCSGAAFMADVAVARACSLAAQRRAESRLRPLAEFEEHGATSVSLAQAVAQLRTLTAKESATPSALAKRVKVYDDVAVALRDQSVLDQHERLRDRRHFIHDEIWNCIEGGANFAAGAVIANAGFRYHPKPNLRSQYFGARHFLTRFSWGAVAFTPSASGGIIDTPGEAIVIEMLNRRDRHTGVAPEVILSRRLDKLQEAAALLSAP